MLIYCSIEFLYLFVVIYLIVYRNLLYVCIYSVNIIFSNEEKNIVFGMFDIDIDNLYIEREEERDDIER